MTCHSKAPIYYMTARVAFKKKKKVHERVVWIVSVFDNPSDITRHDGKTMHRLEQEMYGKNAKSDKAHHHSRNHRQEDDITLNTFFR